MKFLDSAHLFWLQAAIIMIQAFRVVSDCLSGSCVFEHQVGFASSLFTRFSRSEFLEFVPDQI